MGVSDFLPLKIVLALTNMEPVSTWSNKVNVPQYNEVYVASSKKIPSLFQLQLEYTEHLKYIGITHT